MKGKLTGIISSLLPGFLYPCAVCYGNPDSPMAHGMNMGILTLLGFIATVLLIIAVSIVTISIRTKKLSNS